MFPDLKQPSDLIQKDTESAFNGLTEALQGWIKTGQKLPGIFFAESLESLVNIPKTWLKTGQSHFGGFKGLHPERNLALPGVGWAYIERYVAEVMIHLENSCVESSGWGNHSDDAAFGPIGQGLREAAGKVNFPIKIVNFPKKHWKELMQMPELDEIKQGGAIGEIVSLDRSPFYIVKAGIYDPEQGAANVLRLFLKQLELQKGNRTALGEISYQYLSEPVIQHWLIKIFGTTQNLVKVHLTEKGISLGEYISQSHLYPDLVVSTDAGNKEDNGFGLNWFWRGVKLLSGVDRAKVLGTLNPTDGALLLGRQGEVKEIIDSQLTN